LFLFYWKNFQGGAADEEFKVNLEGNNHMVLRTLLKVLPCRRTRLGANIRMLTRKDFLRLVRFIENIEK